MKEYNKFTFKLKEKQKGGIKMLISEKVSSLVRHKRVDNGLTKSAVAEELNIARRTLVKIEAGNYDAPKRIYESVMNWLIEDL
ncbi:transcriptional regulator [Streptococcus equinus]|nr:transcriptional regulator [Streptococcus equinus]